MTHDEIARWVDGIELDLANVASDDAAWRIRELARRQVYDARGLAVPEFRTPFWDQKPGQVT